MQVVPALGPLEGAEGSQDSRAWTPKPVHTRCPGLVLGVSGGDTAPIVSPQSSLDQRAQEGRGVFWERSVHQGGSSPVFEGLI